jgi:signal transduction histidine kinase
LENGNQTMNGGLTRSRFRNVYFGLAAIWLTASLCTFVAIDNLVVPQLIRTRAQAIESLVRSQHEALLLNDNRATRDELIREGMIVRDQDFEELRSPDSEGQTRLADILNSCKFVTSLICANAQNVTVLSEAIAPSSSPSFAILLKTRYLVDLSDLLGWKLAASFIIGILLGLAAWAIRQQEKFLLSKIELLATSFSKIEKSFRSEGIDSSSSSGDEFSLLSEGLEQAGQLLDRKTSEIEQFKRDFEKKTQLEQLATIGEMASQVAHDIRSPLAALNMASRHLEPLPEEIRLLISGAIHRISDIANQLLQKNKEVTGRVLASNIPKTLPKEGNHLQPLIDSIISEKRLEFRSRIGLEIDAGFDSASYGLFVKADPIELKRIISNLLNNATEGLEGSGKIVVNQYGMKDFIELQIQDNGKGIPPEILSKLGKRGETFGKADGSGLGLYHARTSMEAWGGSLDIRSELGKGTTVTLRFIKTNTPAWFTNRLSLVENSPVVVVDDDLSVHRIWKGRLESIGARDRGIELFHFSTPKIFSDWLSEQPPNTGTTFLIDYEFSGDSKNGLDLIGLLGNGERAILVTSRYEEPNILKKCENLRIQLIPKGMAGLVPIEIIKRTLL